jgi:hypothetical protein
MASTVFSQFDGAEMIADKHGFSRDALDAYALESHRRRPPRPRPAPSHRDRADRGRPPMAAARTALRSTKASAST